MGARRAARLLAAHLPLGLDPDGEGELFATLVRHGEATTARHAVVALHGYTDYFFNTELAEHFNARGFVFYALDLHKCGRSGVTVRPPTSPPIWRATTRSWNGRWLPSPPTRVAPRCAYMATRRVD